jgi:hypothetical protein
MSKGLNDYVDTIAPKEEENTPQQESPYIPVEEAGIEQILRTKDVV